MRFGDLFSSGFIMAFLLRAVVAFAGAAVLLVTRAALAALAT
jgi:hypothetical protein